MNILLIKILLLCNRMISVSLNSCPSMRHICSLISFMHGATSDIQISSKRSKTIPNHRSIPYSSISDNSVQCIFHHENWNKSRQRWTRHRRHHRIKSDPPNPHPSLPQFIRHLRESKQHGLNKQTQLHRLGSLLKGEPNGTNKLHSRSKGARIF